MFLSLVITAVRARTRSVSVFSPRMINPSTVDLSCHSAADVTVVDAVRHVYVPRIEKYALTVLQAKTEGAKINKCPPFRRPFRFNKALHAHDTPTVSGGNNSEELLPVTPQQNDLSSRQEDETPQHVFSWGDISGAVFCQQISTAFCEIVKWRRNIFLVPTGKAGKNFLKELTKPLQTPPPFNA